jgi:hypothetical protein
MKCISCAEEQRHNLLEVGCNEVGLKHHCEDLANEVIDDLSYAQSNVSFWHTSKPNAIFTDPQRFSGPSEISDHDQPRFRVQ